LPRKTSASITNDASTVKAFGFGRAATISLTRRLKATMDYQPQDNGSPETVEDYRVYKEGMIFPKLNKKIHILTVVEKDYIVFLDDDLHVHYYNSDDYPELPEGNGDVFARQADLEATSGLLLKNTQLETHRRLLGEAIARLYGDETVVYADQMLDRAADFLRARSGERARMWYLSATLVATCVVLLLGLGFWINKDAVLKLLAFDYGAAEVFLGAAMGSLGALISVLLRSNKLELDASAGARVHYFEGIMRVLVGALAGLLFVLAVKANILLGAIARSDKALTILLVISIAAGASEQLLPNLIDQISLILIGGTKKAQLNEIGTKELSDNGANADNDNGQEV
jgi:hypothetical protein